VAGKDKKRNADGGETDRVEVRNLNNMKTWYTNRQIKNHYTLEMTINMSVLAVIIHF
jgi:hypothetical protein